MDILSVLRGKVEQAEIYTVKNEATQISFEANEMKSAEVEEIQGIALRCLVDGRLGFTAASGPCTESELIDNLLASAQFGDPVPLAFPGAAPAPDVRTHDPSLADVPLSRLVEIGREIIATLRAVDGDAQVNVSIERSEGLSCLRNTVGAETSQPSSSLSISMSIERVRGDDVLLIGDWLSDISLTDDYREVTARLGQKMALAKRGASLRSGRMPVLFSPGGALVLALPIILAINGQNVQRGTSPLSDKVGATIFDPQVTLWDDPTLPGRPASSRYDGEGVPCYRKALIRQGVCEGFIYDLRTAALMGTRSTGNGARSLFTAPAPSPSNLVLESGDKPLAEILAGVAHGLLVEDVLGLGQGNPLSGAFSNTLGLAYVIERGEIVGRVKDVSIAGNIYDHLREVAALSRESYWVHGSIRLPYILLPELNVVCQSS